MSSPRFDDFFHCTRRKSELDKINRSGNFLAAFAFDRIVRGRCGLQAPGVEYAFFYIFFERERSANTPTSM